MRSLKLLRRSLVVFTVFHLGAMALRAEAPAAPSEYDVKAAFLYNFSLFTDWPETALQNRDAFVIGILGDDPFGGTLDQLVQGKTAHGKPMVVKHYTNPLDARDSQVLYIGLSQRENLGSILSIIGHAPVLTVSDADRFLSRGGIIGFTLEDERVRFNINVAAAEKAGILVSSQLLKVAKVVKGLNP